MRARRQYALHEERRLSDIGRGAHKSEDGHDLEGIK